MNIFVGHRRYYILPFEKKIKIYKIDEWVKDWAENDLIDDKEVYSSALIKDKKEKDHSCSGCSGSCCG